MVQEDLNQLARDIIANNIYLSYRLFKIVPEHFYVGDPDSSTDKRVEVFVK